jgi:hypothetical protein
MTADKGREGPRCRGCGAPMPNDHDAIVASKTDRLGRVLERTRWRWWRCQHEAMRYEWARPVEVIRAD